MDARFGTIATGGRSKRKKVGPEEVVLHIEDEWRVAEEGPTRCKPRVPQIASPRSVVAHPFRLYAPPITCLPSRNNAYFFPFFSLLVSTFLSYISAMRFRCEERKERNMRPSPVSSVYFIRNNDRPFPLYLCFSIISAISRKIYFSSTRFDRSNRGDGLIENKT